MFVHREMEDPNFTGNEKKLTAMETLRTDFNKRHRKRFMTIGKGRKGHPDISEPWSIKQLIDEQIDYHSLILIGHTIPKTNELFKQTPCCDDPESLQLWQELIEEKGETCQPVCAFIHPSEPNEILFFGAKTASAHTFKR